MQPRKEALRTFVEFVKFDQAGHACCKVAQEAANDDPSGYNCETCVVAKAYRDLHRHHWNVRAWSLFQQVATRFVSDSQAAGLVFERLTRDEPLETYLMLLDRVSLIYDVWCPEEKAANGA